MNILCNEQVSKRFGSHQVLDSVTFSIPEGSVFGFLGQNGAGKTTMMKLILGLLKPDKGTIRVCDETVTYGQTKTNRHIGYLPDVPEYYGYMKPKEYLKMCGEITGMSREEIIKRSQELLGLVGLEQADKKIGGFSRGMKQRLGIAQALLNEPKLLICDEPTSALDPIGRKEILDILGQIKGKTTVLFSTHILSDVERICDRIAVLHDGKLALCGTLAEMKENHKKDSIQIEFNTIEEVEKFMNSKFMMEYLDSSQKKENSIVLHGKDINTMERAAICTLESEMLLPKKLEVLEPTLESLFMEVTR
ncbi:ABC transporter ATP-binding protein [Anaeromicropila populeti]|uniref:ABC-2 type transport system ATP-binding protein n=1 Tax=Anaeromicropila populeti TaxID=37658 RepID=A0A1I6JCS8_9FIRM|nr:ABC transporter ATP-binding protein [Anaeromicropila populeti]SFR76761.1 ABC-2 type transport system ATP-binding protein [Anaeromicropila populeti]